MTVLFWAARRGHAEVVKALLAHSEIDVNAKNNHGMTALMAAAENGYTEVVKALLGHSKIDVNVASRRGWTALMIAAKRETEVVNALRRTVRLMSMHKSHGTNGQH